MSVLCLTPDRNVVKKDYTGAFLPAAQGLVKKHSGEIVAIDVTKRPGQRALRVIAAIEKAVSTIKKLDAVAFCCHGLRWGIPQLGFTRTNVDMLAHALSRIGSKVRILLLACSTGGRIKKGPANGDGSYADLLRDALCRAGAVDCSVIGHTTAGVALTNPFVRIFEGLGSPVGGFGGLWVVDPKSPLFLRWKTALKGDLAFRFPWMPVGQIHRELVSPVGDFQGLS